MTMAISSRTSVTSSSWQTLAGPAIVVGSVLFNFGLAFVNANIVGVSASHVILAEGCLVAAAHFVILRNYDRCVSPWYLLLVFLVLLTAARWSFSGSVDPKALRDAVLIPTFIALGVVARQKYVNRMLLLLQCIVTLVVLVEILAVNLYGDLLDVRGFYIATRGVAAEAFWNTDSNLFISATRPDERNLFAFLNIHRASSVFLEPVSLGNYCIIIAAYVASHAREMSRGRLLFYFLSTLTLLIACDGRLAILVTLAIVALSPFRPMIRNASFWYLPAAVALSFCIAALAGVAATGDNFLGRSVIASHVLSRFGVAEYLGVSKAGWAQNPDSGITHFIATQSILGVAMIWLFVILGLSEATKTQAVFKRSAMIFLVSTMLISNSYLSIKTAALLWFLLGASQTIGQGRPRPAPAAR